MPGYSVLIGRCCDSCEDERELPSVSVVLGLGAENNNGSGVVGEGVNGLEEDETDELYCGVLGDEARGRRGRVFGESPEGDEDAKYAKDARNDKVNSS